MVDISKMPGHLIRRLNQISASVFADHMTRAGHDFTSVQFAAMSTISANPGLDQATLAGLIAYDRATMGGVIDRLESKQLISRRVSQTDRRAKQLFLTQEGEQTLQALAPLVTELQHEILQGLNDLEKRQLLALLEKVTSAGNQLSRAPLHDKTAP